MAESTYRKADHSDAEDIARLADVLWDELGPASGLLGRITEDGVLARMSELDDRGAFFICDDGGVCGFAIVQPDVSHPQEAVLGVWLLAEARGKGHGRELAVAGTEFAKEAGYKRLRGIIPDGNEPALSFFGDFASIAQMVGQGMEYELPL